LFAYWIKILQISKQLSYKLVYRRELILIIDYGLYREIIIKRLLKITDKILQFREIIRRTIWKVQRKVIKKFLKRRTYLVLLGNYSVAGLVPCLNI